MWPRCVHCGEGWLMMSISGTRLQSLDGLLKVLPLEWFGIDNPGIYICSVLFVVLCPSQQLWSCQDGQLT